MRLRRPRVVRPWLVLAALVWSAPGAHGQQPDGTEVELRWSAGDPTVVEAWLRADLDGLLIGLAGVPDVADRIYGFELLRRGGDTAVQAAVEKLEELLLRRTRVRADGTRLVCTVRFPDRVDRDGALVSLGGRAVLAAQVPAAATSVSFFGSRAFRGILLVSHLGDATVSQVLLPGEESRALPLTRRPPA